MRSRQINFLINYDELLNIEPYLKEAGWAIIETNSPNEEPILAESVCKQNKTDRIKVYLVQKDMLTNIKMRYIEKQERYFVDTFYDAEIVELLRPYYDEEANFVRRGRLYYQQAYYDENDELVMKSEEFLNAANKLFRAFRKTFKNVKLEGYKQYLVTQNTVNLVQEEGLELKKN